MSRRDELVACARALLEAEGRDAVTMRRLGESLGVRAPSLYKHVRGKDELEEALAKLGLEELAAAVAVAAAGALDVLSAAVGGYRRYALAHPHLYRLLTERPLPDGHAAGPEEARAVGLVAQATGGRDRARAAWAFAHGMVRLELAGRLPPGADLEAAWQAGIAAFRAPPPHAAAGQGVATTIVRSVRGPD